MDVHTIFIASGGTGGSLFSGLRRRNTRLDQVHICPVLLESQPEILLVDKEDDIFIQRLKELFDMLYSKSRSKEERYVKIPYYRVFAERKVKGNTAIKENPVNGYEKFELLFWLHKKKFNFAKLCILRKKFFQKLNIQKLAAFFDKQLSGLSVMQKIKLHSRQPVPLILS